MRDIDHREFRDSLRMQQSRAPCNRRAPIVTREKNLLLAELIRNRNYVRYQLAQRIGSDTGRLTAEVVPALVGDDDTKSRSSQRLNLPVPPLPEFRKAVEENHDWTVFRPGSDSMESHKAVLEGDGFRHGVHDGESLHVQ